MVRGVKNFMKFKIYICFYLLLLCRLLFAGGEIGLEDFNSCKKAAEEGDPVAQFKLGTIYKDGKDVKQSYQDAFEWYKKSSKQGNVDAQRELGNLYMSAGENNKNMQSKYYKEASKWYKRAAKQGDINAQCNLGKMYSSGKGVEQNYSVAFEWFKKAAEQGNAEAQYELSCLYNIADSQHDGNQNNHSNEVFKWLKKAAEQGNAKAQNKLGDMYVEGEVVEKNVQEGIKWIKNAAEQKNPEALFNLACKLLKFGNKTEQITAIFYMHQAANLGNVNAQYSLGLMYYTGKGGCIRNQDEAFKWFIKAAQQGDVDARMILISHKISWNPVDIAVDKIVKKQAEQQDEL